MSRKILIWIVLLLAFSGGANASLLNLDFCQFKGEGSSVYLEVYFDLPRSSITYKSTDDGWFGALSISNIVSRGDKAIAYDSWEIEDVLEDIDGINSKQRLIDVRIYQLQPGIYQFHITAKDSLSEKTWETEPSVEIEAFAEDKLTLSDIELASHITTADLQPKFDRGPFSLVPNPRRIFGGEDPFLIYYIEIYPDSMRRESHFSIERTVLNGIKDTVLAAPKIIRETAHPAFADFDSVRLGELKGGTYSLEIKVTNDAGKSSSKSKRFFVHNPEIEKQVEFTLISDSTEVMDELEKIEFLLKPGQKKAVRRMTMPEKTLFVNEFWKRLDNDPSNLENPTRDEFHRRVETSDRKWSNSRRAGHLTDRGRVYVLYGSSSQIERFPHQSDSKPYQIWTYDQLDGGAIFVFVDRNGLGEYELVHSNLRGEISNPSWYDVYVRRSGVDTRR